MGGPRSEAGPRHAAGKLLRLERGLAEIEFDSGARVILQGPGRARAHLGKLREAALRNHDRAGSRIRARVLGPYHRGQGCRPRDRVRLIGR